MASLNREDIAALTVVADGHRSHGLNLDHIDLGWILADPPEEISSTASSSRRRHAGASSASSDCPAPVMQLEYRDSSVPEGMLQERSLDTPAPAQDTASSKQTSMSRDRSPSATFGILNLTALDHEAICPRNPRHVLLDSPRSVFIVLSNGYSVESLCRADPQVFYNEALRTGVPLDMVNLRIAADNKRRSQRYLQLRDAYIKLREKNDLNEVVSAVRDQKYGVEVEAVRNRRAMASIPRYAYHGGEDLGLLDEDCRRVLEHSRSSVIDEVRRALELHEKKLQQSIQAEAKLLSNSTTFEAEKRVEEMKERDRRQRSVAIQKRTEEFRQRIQRIRQEQEEHSEDLRQRVELKEREHEEFRLHQTELRRMEVAAGAEHQHHKRMSIKEQVHQRDEERREELIRKAEYMAKLHQRDLERKRQQKAKESMEMQEINEGRSRAIRQIAAMQLEEKRLKSEDAIERSNQRAAEFKQSRAMRFEARKKLLAERAERGAVARRIAEEKRDARAKETAEEYERKQQFIADVAEEHRQQLTLQKELSKQTRLVQLEDQQRCKSVSLFRSVAYLADAAAKASWLERENKKRDLLALQVRQEREALHRARDLMQRQAEEAEIERRKQTTFSMLNQTV